MILPGKYFTNREGDTNEIKRAGEVRLPHNTPHGPNIDDGLPHDLARSQTDFLARIVFHGPHTPKGKLVLGSIAMTRLSVHAVVAHTEREETFKEFFHRGVLFLCPDALYFENALGTLDTTSRS